jgi:polygalacturonase
MKHLILWFLLASPALADIDVTAYGAVGDGVTDNSAAFAAAITAAEAAHQNLYIPPGTFAYGDVIRLNDIQITGAGPTSALKALNWQSEAIFLQGNGSGVKSLRLTGVVAPTRQGAWESTRITVFGAQNFEISDVVIEGSSGAGIQLAHSAQHGIIRGNTITGTLSDSIHMTDGAAHILVENNRIRRSGDDGIAVVSYQGEPTVHDIVARGNDVRNNLWGRQMSVVGGRNVRYYNNRVAGNRAGFAGIYIAQEDSFATKAARHVVIRRNAILNSGSVETGHGAVMIFSEGSAGNTNITVRRNRIHAGAATGIVERGTLNTGIVLDQNAITTTGQAYEVEPTGVTVTDHTTGPVGPKKHRSGTEGKTRTKH